MSGFFKAIGADVAGSVVAKVLLVIVVALVYLTVDSFNAVRTERARVDQIKAQSAAAVAAMQNPAVEVKPRIIERVRVVVKEIPAGKTWGQVAWSTSSPAVVIEERERIEDGGSVSMPVVPKTELTGEQVARIAGMETPRVYVAGLLWNTDNRAEIVAGRRVMRSADVSVVAAVTFNVPGGAYERAGLGLLVRF